MKPAGSACLYGHPAIYRKDPLSYAFKYNQEKKSMEALYCHHYCDTDTRCARCGNTLYENIRAREAFLRLWQITTGILSGHIFVHVHAGSFPRRHLSHLYGIRRGMRFPPDCILLRPVRLSGNGLLLRKRGNSCLPRAGSALPVEQQPAQRCPVLCLPGRRPAVLCGYLRRCRIHGHFLCAFPGILAGTCQWRSGHLLQCVPGTGFPSVRQRERDPLLPRPGRMADLKSGCL